MDSQSPFSNALFDSLLTSYSRARRLEDRIRKLCADAVTTTEVDELNRILRELSNALRDHTARMRTMMATRTLQHERRKTIMN
jgi:hypothetical protein